MKKYIVLLILNLLTILISAQSDIRFNNVWNQPYIINPASITDQYLAEFNVIARQQWVGFQGSPTTLFASGTLYLDNLHTQFGLKVMQDKIGFTSTTDIDLTYAYSLSINNAWRLNMGLGLDFQSLAYDVSMVNSSTATDPTVLTKLLNVSYINSQLGAELTNKSWRVGIASQNLNSLISPINKLFVNTNFMYVLYRNSRHGTFNLGYGVYGIQYSTIYQMEFNLTGYFNYTADREPIQLGLIYRTWSEVGLLVGLDISKNLRVSYSYDYNVSGISRASIGTQELMLTFRLDKAEKCINCSY